MIGEIVELYTCYIEDYKYFQFYLGDILLN